MTLIEVPLPDFDTCLNTINDFINHQLIRNLSVSSIDLYREVAVSFLSIISPEMIEKKYIIEYVIESNDNSSSRKNSRLTALRVILKYLTKRGFLNCDIKLENIKIVVKFPEYVSEFDMKVMINSFKRDKLKCKGLWRGRRDYAILLFMYATGLRASEIINFKYCDLEENWLRVENGKGSKDRYIPIAQVAINAINDYRKYLPTNIKSSTPYVFITDLLVPFTRLTLNNYCHKKFNMNPHLIRHTYATHLVTNGCDVNVLSEFLGHSSLATTQIYSNIQPFHLKNTIDNFHPMA